MTVKPAAHILPLALPLFLASVLIISLSFPAMADTREMLGSFRDWDAIKTVRDNGEKFCHIISMPKSTQPAGANRGDIYITITHRPRRKVRDEVNIVMGYPLRTGSEVTATIGGGSYGLFSEGTTAWHYTQEDDAEMVTAMKRGNSLVVRGTSSRGTNTTDRYSLTGFTAAYNAITAACN